MLLALVDFLFQSIFQCKHERTTFPMTLGKSKTSLRAPKSTYVTCLDCGKEFLYDWKKMSIGAAITLPPATLSVAPITKIQEADSAV